MNLRRIACATLCFLLLAGWVRAETSAKAHQDSELQWPPATAQARPWTRWWWLGSAVDRENLTRRLAEYQQAGFGGVEICPIYGTKGYENQFLDFLSPEWTAMLEHTLREAKRLDFGVDLTTGTGWPFGGPNVGPDIASTRLIMRAGDTIRRDDLQGSPICILAVSEDGRRLDLTKKLPTKGAWKVPTGEWRVYALTAEAPIQQVKRAAPGGEGNVLDPYSTAALDAYLARFERPLASIDGVAPRAHFHDSFEYYEATWTDQFLDEFQSRRGYDLVDQLPLFFGDGMEDTVARIKCDYRETIFELHREFIERWTEWCHSRGSLSRNQAHGAPGNLIDLYAAADIPETEIFGALDMRQYPMLKFATSAANLKGRTLVSAEAFTWLDNHFQVPLSKLKPSADFFFLCGINHLIYHGIPYSPTEAPWPGWQFYAAVNFGPDGGLWRDLPEFNAYVTRCQSVLQSGKPSSDILLYFPVHDIWLKGAGLVMQFTTEAQSQWLWPTAHYQLATRLWDRGYTFDQASDRLLAGAEVDDGQVVVDGNQYCVVLVPHCRLMPVETLRKLTQLAEAGATILFEDELPADVPGWGNLETRRVEFRKLIDVAAQGNLGGRIVVGPPETMLEQADVPREPLADNGIHFIRRAEPEGYSYFLVTGKRPLNGWVPLGRPAKSALLMDPLSATRIGLAAIRENHGATEVFLQLAPTESLVLKTFTHREVEAEAWNYVQEIGGPSPIEGTWTVEFIEGGPELPAGFETAKLASWAERDDAQRFAGTARYTIEFDRPLPVVRGSSPVVRGSSPVVRGSPDPAPPGGTVGRPATTDWRLDLGRVCENARVKLNGQKIATLWCEPFQVDVGQWLQPGKNVLEIEVTNLAANRIRDLDRRGVKWKYFYDINFVNRQYQPFDASDWPLRDSGLLGPDTLEPLRRIEPQ